MASAQLQSVARHATGEHRHLYELASKLYSDAVAQHDERLLLEACALAEAAQQLRPDHLAGLNLLARIELQRQRTTAAEYWVNRGLSIKPDSASLLYSAGHIALSQNQLDSAEEYFTRSARISRVATRAVNFLAHVKLLQGDYVEAFRHYRELVKTQARDKQIRSKLFESASHVVADFYSEELEQDLLRYLDFTDVDYSQLRGLATSLLKHKLRLSEAGCPLELETIASDNLLIKCMKRFYFCDPLIERLLLTLRQSLLLSCSSNLAIKRNFIPLAAAIAEQSALNEYVWYITEQEDSLARQLEILCGKMLRIDELKADDIYPALLLLLMYRPLNQCDFFPNLSHKTLQWPKIMDSIVRLAMTETHFLNTAACDIPTLGESADAVSEKVQQQYNQNPYPRWTDIGYSQPGDYRAALKAAFPDYTLSAEKNGRLNILVAGCGTGRHAIRLAQYFPEVHVTALDLSHIALAYAKYQADKRQSHNIDFIQGDILQAHKLQQHFDVIECSGVLHHMQSPQEGLRALANQLKPGGMIKIALYSATARKQISQLRQLWGNKLPRMAAEIRLVREALLQGSIAGEWKEIYNSPDFYSLSACRDLLFHEQEHVFNLPELERYLAQAGLQWMGMLPPPDAHNLLSLSGKHCSRITIAEWHTMEQNNPQLFAGMYQFYALKPGH